MTAFGLLLVDGERSHEAERLTDGKSRYVTDRETTNVGENVLDVKEAWVSLSYR
jgi:hypothetical protein